MITYLDTNEYLKMKITTIKREVLVVEDKQIEYANGIVCQYTLTNNELTNYVLKTPTDNVLNCLIKDTTLIKNHTFSNIHNIFQHHDYKNENELVSITDKEFACMHVYNGSGGLLYDINGEHVPMASQLSNLEIYIHMKNTYENMNLLNNFINELDFLEVIEKGKVESVQHYNRDDDLDYSQYEINKLAVYISDVNLYKKYVGKSKFFQRDMLCRDIGKLFFAKYPHLENHED